MKAQITVFLNFGAVVLIISALMLAVGYIKIEEGETKLIYILIGWIAVMFSLIAWDALTGINIIEEKVKAIEEQLKK